MQRLYFFTIVVLFSLQSLSASELTVVTHIPFQETLYELVNRLPIHIRYVGENKVITYPAKTVFDQSCFVYEPKKLAYPDTTTVLHNNRYSYLQNTNENIRQGIIGQAVKKYGKTQNHCFYETTEQITIIKKFSSKL